MNREHIVSMTTFTVTLICALLTVFVLSLFLVEFVATEIYVPLFQNAIDVMETTK